MAATASTGLPQEPLANKFSYAPKELDVPPQVMTPRQVARAAWRLSNVYASEAKATAELLEWLGLKYAENVASEADVQAVRVIASVTRLCVSGQLASTLGHAPHYAALDASRPTEFTRVRPPLRVSDDPTEWGDNSDENELLDPSPQKRSFRIELVDTRTSTTTFAVATPSSFFDLPERFYARSIYPEKILWRPPREGGPRLFFQSSQASESKGPDYPDGPVPPPSSLGLSSPRPNIALRFDPLHSGQQPPPGVFYPPPLLVSKDFAEDQASNVWLSLSERYRNLLDMEDHLRESMPLRQLTMVRLLRAAVLRCAAYSITTRLRNFSVYALAFDQQGHLEPSPLPGTYLYREVYVKDATMPDLKIWLESPTFTIPPVIRVHVSYYPTPEGALVSPGASFLLTTDSYFAYAPDWNYEASQPTVLYDPSLHQTSQLYGIPFQPLAAV